MDKKKSQHYNFCFEVMPSLFHSQTDDFMTYLQRDGLKFLEFWWNHVGQQLPFEQLVPFSSLKYEIVERTPSTKIIFITLPPPKNEGEMFFMALIRNPEKRFAWVRLPSTRMIGLVKRSKDKYKSGTELGDLTPRAIFVSIGEGPTPTMQEFKDKIFDLTKPRTTS
jgi:hypothetical protein